MWAFYDGGRVRCISITAEVPHSKSSTYFSIHTLRHEILQYTFNTVSMKQSGDIQMSRISFYCVCALYNNIFLILYGM